MWVHWASSFIISLQARNLRDTYFPIETNPHLTIEEKLPKMIEW
jgi:hypothetical protein